MKFKDFAVKNFKHNLKAYGAFYLCSTFTVTLFFIFSTLFYNSELSGYMKEAYDNMLLNISLIFTFVFAILFVSYVHTSMKKNRGREFGLLLTFGLTARDIGRMIVVEDMILSFASVVSGILTGALFSRLVHMAVNRIMDFHMPFHLGINSFLLTSAAFLVIFFLVIAKGWLDTRKLTIAELLKEGRKSEQVRGESILFLIAGVIMTVVFITVSVLAKDNRETAMNTGITLSAILCGMLGTYLMISNLVPFLLSQLKKRSRQFQKHLILLAEARFSLGKNKKLIYLSSILCAVIIPSFAISYGMGFNIKNMINASHGPDITYIEAFGVNGFSVETVQDLIREEKRTFVGGSSMPCLFVESRQLTNEKGMPVVAFSLKDYNTAFKKGISLKKGEALLSGDSMLLPKIPQNRVEIKTTGDSMALGLVKQENLPVLSLGMAGLYKYTLVLNDVDYTILQNRIPRQKGMIHKYWIDNWELSDGLLEKMDLLSQQSKNQATGTNPYAQTLGVTGNLDGYRTFKKVNSMIIFICSFLCLLFYVASVLLLILRQFEAAERTRRKYRQLRKIGITGREFSKTVLGEIRILFLTPVLFGTILSIGLIMICIGIFGIPEPDTLMRNAGLLTLVYILQQVILCQVVGLRFARRVMMG